jgi:hypothetical protein
MTMHRGFVGGRLPQSGACPGANENSGSTGYNAPDAKRHIAKKEIS